MYFRYFEGEYMEFLLNDGTIHTNFLGIGKPIPLILVDLTFSQNNILKISFQTEKKPE